MLDCNSDEANAPSWMDKEYFELVLRTYEKTDSIFIDTLEITPGSSKGDHFASILFRVVATYRSDINGRSKISMIVKTLPQDDGFKKQVLEKSPIFKTEIQMYSEHLPKFERSLKQHGDDTQLCPKIIYYSLTPHKVIILEDLTKLGYTSLHGSLPTEDEVKMCLTKIAKWHAVSYKLAEEGDESIKTCNNGLLSSPQENQPHFVTGGMESLGETLSKVEGLQQYSDKILAKKDTIIPKCNDIFNAYERGCKAIMVLNHGDFDIMNIMLRYDSNGICEDVMIVDFQDCCYGPATIDITFSIYLMMKEDMRRYRREEFVYFYFSIFLDTLKKIGFSGDLPTLADFYCDFYKFKEFELWIVASFLPLVHSFASEQEPKELEELLSSDEAQASIRLLPSYLAELKWLLPRLLYNGYLD